MSTPPSSVTANSSNGSAVSNITNTPTGELEAALAVAAAAEVATKNKKKGGTKGSNFSLTEDLYLCRSWIAASEDPEVGTNLKSAEFRAKFHSNYVTFLTNQNNRMNTSYPFRSSENNMKRFKKLSKYVLKFLGVKESMGPPPSGDNEQEKFYELCEKTFIERYPEAKNMLENVSYVEEYMSEKPKWRSHQEEVDKETLERQQKRKERPIGTKKAKEQAADKALVTAVLEQEKEPVSSAKKRIKHMKKTEQFMVTAGESMTGILQVLKDSKEEEKDLRIMEALTPKSKSEMAKELALNRIHELRLARNQVATALNFNKENSNNTVTLDDSSSDGSLDEVDLQQATNEKNMGTGRTLRSVVTDSLDDGDDDDSDTEHFNRTTNSHEL